MIGRLIVLVQLLVSTSLLSAELPCEQSAGDYNYGAGVGEVIQPTLLSKSQYQNIQNLFRRISNKRRRHGSMQDFVCSGGEQKTNQYKVSSSQEYDYEGLLVIRGEALSTTNSVKQIGSFRLKLLDDSLQLWGRYGGSDIDLIHSATDQLVYREVRRTRRAGGGFTQRNVVTEIIRKGAAFTIEERIYIGTSLYGWRLWEF